MLYYSCNKEIANDYNTERKKEEASGKRKELMIMGEISTRIQSDRFRCCHI